MSKVGVLLLNIGSPDSFQEKDVDRYLRRFLMDKDIISAPFFVRWPLVNWGIVPKRAAFSAANYKKIWMKEGSPLLVYSRQFADQLQKELGEQFVVQLGMRYSAPEISDALKVFAQNNVEKIIALPMYPQYAEATTGSSLKELKKQMRKTGHDFPLEIIYSFFDKNFFTKTVGDIAKETLQEKTPDHYLFSFHGLPRRQIQKKTGCLKNGNACTDSELCRTYCYRNHCLTTAQQIAAQMQLTPEQWSISFQSRLGPIEWMRPYTDEHVWELAQKGVRHLAVLCPAFVADCVETLEEIGVGEKENFLRSGGKEFTLVPCVNAHPAWVQGMAKFLANH
jgi:ferrochelatase